MQLSSKGRYAVMAMADLARNDGEGPVPLAAIADRQYLSQTYLEQIFLKLRRAGLVNSMRGPGGGYSLAHAPHDITIAAVMLAVEEPVQMTRCHLEDTEPGGCAGDSRCLTHDLWRALGDHIVAFLGGVSLGDVIDNAAAKEAARGMAITPLQASAEASEKMAAKQ